MAEVVGLWIGICSGLYHSLEKFSYRSKLSSVSNGKKEVWCERDDSTLMRW